MDSIIVRNSGTQPCQSQLYREAVLPHLNDALCLAFWLAGDEASAEDIVQRSFLRAWAEAEDLNGDARCWLLAHVRTAAYEWLADHAAKSPALPEYLTLTADGAGRSSRAKVVRGEDRITTSSSPADVLA